MITCKGLGFSVGGKPLLQGIDVHLPRGKVIAVIGPNGAGKSTLLRLLMGFNKPTLGEIFLEGKPLPSYSAKELGKIVGYVPQSQVEPPPFRVGEFVLMSRYAHISLMGRAAREDRSQVQMALLQTGVAHLKDRLMHTLSGGERQRVFLAGALAGNPKLLITDEAMAFLDPRQQLEMGKRIATAQKTRGYTQISATHDMARAVNEAHMILALREGRQFFFGTPEQLLGENILEQLFDIPFYTFRKNQGAIFPIAGTVS